MAEERIRAIQSRKDSEAGRVEFMLEHMAQNKAYLYASSAAGGDPDGTLLEEYRQRLLAYRGGWSANPALAIDQGLHHTYVETTGYGPLCVDIEVAAVCDLACPFCFRQQIATPDKIMREDLYYRVIDQCAELGVPSVKLNWRGEPLLQPKLPEFIDYAKQNGIVETLINTDAVTLTEDKSRALIAAGLDLMIYSFDGGSKETYEQMRPGRFHTNSFERVYENIRRFDRLRGEMGSAFPRTKIQMILTGDTFDERESFFELFSDCVDDVSVKAYSERGGQISDLDDASRTRIRQYVEQRGLPDTASHWRDLDGNLFVSTGRLPCEQPYQRLMVTYNGSVSMCCYDWGQEHPIGYIDARAYDEGLQPYEEVKAKADHGARGFEMMAGLELPSPSHHPPEEVRSLAELWNSEAINEVRRLHLAGRSEEIPVCEKCWFKEAFAWEQVPSE